jgi:hypothetical protein
VGCRLHVEVGPLHVLESEVQEALRILSLTLGTKKLQVVEERVPDWEETSD